MYVVSGITGQTGSAVARALLRAGQPVRALVRDAGRAAEWKSRGVELVEGDLNDPKSIAHAFEGADGAYAMVPPDLRHPDPLGYYQAVAGALSEAARSSALPRMVFLSSEGAQLSEGTGPILGAHFAEKILDGAASRVIFLRPAFFQENWRPVFGLAALQGVMPSLLQPLDLHRTQVATRDIGKTAAALLTQADPPGVVELAGPEACSPSDVARFMAEVLGRDVAPVAVPRDAWEETLAGSGVGPAYAGLICQMYDGINAGHVRPSGDAESRVGRTTLLETIKGWSA